MSRFKFLDLIRLVIVLFLLVVYIYNFQLRALPFVPRTMMTVLGFLMFVIDYVSGYVYKYSLRGYTKIVFTIVLLVVWGFVCMVGNGSNEWLYHLMLKEWIALFFAAYLIARLARPLVSNITSIFWLITIAVFIESSIAITGYFNPSFRALIDSIQFNEQLEFIDQDLYFYRVIGLGTAYFFGVLPTCLLGLLSCSYLIAKTTEPIKKMVEIFMFVVIAVTSFLTARTSSVMILLSLIALVLFLGKENKKKVIAALIGGFGILYLLLNFGVSYLPVEMADWVFELNRTGSSGTTDQLMGWWSDTEYSSKTLLIGDAHYGTDSSYYMHVDVGFLRQIYYAGILGLFLKLLVNYQCVKLLSKKNVDKDMVYLGLLFFGGFLIMMTKGDINIYLPVMLIVIMINVCCPNKETSL